MILHRKPRGEIMLSSDPSGSNPQGDRKDKEKIDMALFVEGREAVKVPDGVHPGRITKVEKNIRGTVKQYEYIDIYIELSDIRNKEGELVELRESAPSNLTPNTKLGRILMNFGTTQEQIISNEPIDIEAVLKDKTVTLQTLEETTDRGTFAKVVDGSLKPLKAAGEKPVVNSSSDVEEWMDT